MEHFGKLVLIVSLYALVRCSPFDDGKYKPKAYDEHDDGKYYRPLDEGKYVPGDEGKYTYLYQQGVWPFDGTYKHLELGDSDDYIGFKIYAPRFPYVHSVIKALINKYVSTDSLIYEESQSSDNYFNKVYADNEVTLKCNVLSPEGEIKNNTEFITNLKGVAAGTQWIHEATNLTLKSSNAPVINFDQNDGYPPQTKAVKGEKLGSIYSFKGTKVISKVSNALTNKLRLEYEVIVRVVEDVTE